jgi:8-oxo-dGTP diphosphatase
MTDLHLIRHAHAGSRSEWEDDDALRPLSKRGRAQADAIAEALAGAGIDVLWTSRYLRCRQTLEPLAAMLDLPITDHDLLAEGSWGNEALDALLDAAADGTVIAASSHGDVIPAIVAAATRRGAELSGPRALTKGARYECAIVDGQISRIVAVAAPDRT